MHVAVLIVIIIVAISVPTGLGIFLYFYVKRRNEMEQVRVSLTKGKHADVMTNPAQFVKDAREGKAAQTVSEQDVKDALKRKGK